MIGNLSVGEVIGIASWDAITLGVIVVPRSACGLGDLF